MNKRQFLKSAAIISAAGLMPINFGAEDYSFLSLSESLNIKPYVKFKQIKSVESVKYNGLYWRRPVRQDALVNAYTLYYKCSFRHTCFESIESPWCGSFVGATFDRLKEQKEFFLEVVYFDKDGHLITLSQEQITKEQAAKYLPKVNFDTRLQ